jgi:tetratricopeptide (TPR) repeat protein
VSLRKILAPTAAGMLLFAAALTSAPAAPAAAQEVVQDEGAAYRTWHEASQAGDNAKAMAAAKTYIEQYPKGQYADFMKKWYGTAQMTALDAAIKEKRTADMIVVGRDVLAADPENLNVLYAMASQIRGEMLARPPVFTNAATGVELAKKGIGMVESGKTLAGVATFDKNATLAWMTQMLALSEQKAGNAEEAIRLFEKSTAYAPNDKTIAAPNLYTAYNMLYSRYVEAAKAYNAIPEAERGAAEPSPAVKAARDKINTEADQVIDAAARFVAFGRANGLPAPTVDRVSQTLEAVYKTRFPEDAALDGLKKILADKGVPAA